MLIYSFINNECCPTQNALAIADNKEEALKIVLKKANYQGWKLDGEYEFKKGLLFIGDADC